MIGRNPGHQASDTIHPAVPASVGHTVCCFRACSGPPIRRPGAEGSSLSGASNGTGMGVRQLETTLTEAAAPARISGSAALRNELKYGLRFLVRHTLHYERRIRALLAQERWPRERLDSAADGLLLDTLQAAVRRIPRYHSLKAHLSVGNVREALAEHFPIIDRRDLMVRPADHFPYESAPRPWTIVGRTSGTSGSPLQMFRSLESVLWENAIVERHFRWSGYRPGMRRAYLRGDLVVPIDRASPPYWFHNRYNNQLIVSSRHLRDPCVDDIIEALTRFAPFMMEAYPSTAYELALLLEQRNSFLRIPYVFTGSEPLYPHQRQLIETRLATRVMDHYGMAERIAYATECEYGNLHLNTDYSYVEIVDDDGHPTDDEGYIVGTTFHNSVMPLVRYRMSDRTRWRPGSCACGRTYPMIEPVSGKFEDTLFGSQGQRISPSVVTFAFKALRGIKYSQVAQIGEGLWEIRVVPEAGFNEAERDRLIDNVRKLVDPGLRVVVREVDEIARTTAHKYRWIVNESGHDSKSTGEFRPRTEDPKSAVP
ncbi:MAG: phenylacetate--CoA ligase family protein [Gammaproteobacteria bacterium]|nr:phenylacetate--CoA ligase family protein [Gammaproteobacteria bacterium]